MEGHWARVRPQHEIRAESPAAARYFGLPCAVHFTVATVAGAGAMIWACAARGESKMRPASAVAGVTLVSVTPDTIAIWLAAARGDSAALAAVRLRVVMVKRAKPRVRRIFVFIYFFSGWTKLVGCVVGVFLLPPTKKNHADFFTALFDDAPVGGVGRKKSDGIFSFFGDGLWTARVF